MFLGATFVAVMIVYFLFIVLPTEIIYAFLGLDKTRTHAEKEKDANTIFIVGVFLFFAIMKAYFGGR